jgi:hypothetical protein
MLVDSLRSLWLPAIANVSGNPTGRLNEWVGAGQYYFDSLVGPASASFVLTPGVTLLDTFAAEFSRFSSAAIETSIGISQSNMPKSTAWLFIKAYYAAFYAAHSILRSVGISASNFQASDCQQADRIADALGFSNAPLNAAQFRCEYLLPIGRLECTKAPGPGIHEQFWRIFNSFIQNASVKVLQNKSLPSLDAQDVFAKLTALNSLLSLNGHKGGNWLSTMRNEVTYRQQHQAWFPYGRSRAECDRLFALQKTWRHKPDSIQLHLIGNDAEIFIVGCAFLVSLSVAITEDMAQRSRAGHSFLRSGPLKLLNQTV